MYDNDYDYDYDYDYEQLNIRFYNCRAISIYNIIYNLCIWKHEINKK